MENSPLLCGVHFNLSFALFPTLHRGTSGQTNNHSRHKGDPLHALAHWQTDGLTETDDDLGEGTNQRAGGGRPPPARPAAAADGSATARSTVGVTGSRRTDGRADGQTGGLRQPTCLGTTTGRAARRTRGRSRTSAAPGPLKDGSLGNASISGL